MSRFDWAWNSHSSTKSKLSWLWVYNSFNGGQQNTTDWPWSMCVLKRLSGSTEGGLKFLTQKWVGHLLGSYPEGKEIYPMNTSAATLVYQGVPRNYSEGHQLASDNYGHQGMSPHHGEIDLSDPVSNTARPIPVYQGQPAAYSRPGNLCTTRQGKVTNTHGHRPKCRPRGLNLGRKISSISTRLPDSMDGRKKTVHNSLWPA